MSKLRLSVSALGFALVLFFAVNILSSAVLRSMRIDVTDEQLFTLSEGSVNICRSLEEPITLYYFFSEEQANDRPELKSYAKRVRELLQEYALRSDGNVILEMVDPEPFSPEEDQAVQAGLAALPANQAGDFLYFGLVGRNTLDGEEVIPFFDPRKERFLEYDITRLIYTLAHPDKKTVGLLSGLPLEGGPPANPMDPRGGSPPWQILAQLRTFFEVETLASDMTEVPEGVDVLFLAHPKGLTDEALYAIDQFVLKGGRVLAMVDPHCEAEEVPTDPNNPMAAMSADRSSNLPRLFEAWGVELVPDVVAADRKNALTVTMGGNRPRAVSFVTYLGLGPDEFNDEDPVISELGEIRAAFAGVLQAAEDSEVEFSPLLTTSQESMQIEKSRIQFMPNPEELLTSFVPSGDSLVLAARLSGNVSSAFPDGPPGDAADDEDAAEGEDEPEEGDGHVAESVQPINVVVVSDADLLEDRFWITEQRLGPIRLGHAKTADNGDFVINTLDNLCGSNDLISVRAGSRFSRPFDRVEEIRREAEERYLAESQALEQKLRDTEAKIAELQREQGGNAMLLTEEQLAEIERFREEQVETRKQLRAVQHNLLKDIDSLGFTIKLANILGTPLLFIGVVLGVWLTRRSKRGS